MYNAMWRPYLLLYTKVLLSSERKKEIEEHAERIQKHQRSTSDSIWPNLTCDCMQISLCMIDVGLTEEVWHWQLKLIHGIYIVHAVVAFD